MEASVSSKRRERKRMKRTSPPPPQPPVSDPPLLLPPSLEHPPSELLKSEETQPSREESTPTGELNLNANYQEDNEDEITTEGETDVEDAPDPPVPFEIPEKVDAPVKMEVESKADPEPAPPQPPQEPSKMSFESMFYNAATQKTAWDLLVKEKMVSMKKGYTPMSGKATKSRGRMPSGDLNMKLRSSDAPPINFAAASASEPVTQDELPSPSDLTDKQSDLMERKEVEISVAMVNELMNRYEKNKKKVIYDNKKKAQCHPVADGGGGAAPTNESLSLSDSDDEDIWGDDNLSSSESDFLKFTVPEYEYKVKLRDIHYQKIEGMSSQEIVKICREIIPELKKIMNEEVKCERHEIFKMSGLSKQRLREMTVAEPFTSNHEYHIMNVINDEMLEGRDPLEFNGELMHYVSCVLVPEAMILIYAKANEISREQAEKEMRFGAGYDGPLDKDLIKFVDNYEASNKENVIA